MKFGLTSLGRRVRDARKAAGHTQASLANEVRVKPVTISRLERGKAMTSVEKLLAIADVLGTRVSKLFRPWRPRTEREKQIDRLLLQLRRWKASDVAALVDFLGATSRHRDRLRRNAAARRSVTRMISRRAISRIDSDGSDE